MNTALVIGNGSMLVNINERLYISDLYWPNVGQENHLTSKPNEIFIRANGKLTSLTGKAWDISVHYIQDSLTTRSIAVNQELGLEVLIKDCVLPDKDIFIRIFDVHNTGDQDVEFQLFIKNNFFMIENDIGDTAAWYPLAQVMCHYKKDRYLGIGSTGNLYQFSCAGPNDNHGKGCVPDKDGELKHNPVTTGSAQSCLSYKENIAAGKRASFDSFIVAGTCFDELQDGAEYVREEKSKHLFASTEEYWKNWIKIKVTNKFENGYPLFFDNIEDNKRLLELYKRSILLIRTQFDNGGAIIAANDSSFVKAGGKDSYSYFWPRDGASVALALIEVGFSELVKNFFRYCKQVLTKEGYILHKYYPRVNSGLASSWHPWIDNAGNLQLPIQEDETALIIYALWKHYEKFGDQEFLNEMWDGLVEPAAEFLYEYRYLADKNLNNIDKYVSGYKEKKKLSLIDVIHFDTKLPKPSYDIWELDRGINTYTVATVYGGLQAAANLAQYHGHSEDVQRYTQAAAEVKNAGIEYLFDEKLDRFMRGVYCQNHTDDCRDDKSVDSSLIYLWEMGMLPVGDEKVAKTMNAIEEKLWLNTEVGGFARKEDDHYHQVDKSLPGNPWFISTLWMARYNMRIGERAKAQKYLKWVLDHADYTGLLAEQADPNHGIGISVKPLTWSHAELVRTVNLIQDLA